MNASLGISIVLMPRIQSTCRNKYWRCSLVRQIRFTVEKLFEELGKLLSKAF